MLICCASLPGKFGFGAPVAGAEIHSQTHAGTKFELNKFANRFERELPFGKSVKIFCLVGSQSGLDQPALGFGSEHVFNNFFFTSTLESVGTVSETLRVKASEDVYKRIGQKFEDVKLENSKKQ